MSGDTRRVVDVIDVPTNWHNGRRIAADLQRWVRGRLRAKPEYSDVRVTRKRARDGYMSGRRVWRIVATAVEMGAA